MDVFLKDLATRLRTLRNEQEAELLQVSSAGRRWRVACCHAQLSPGSAARYVPRCRHKLGVMLPCVPCTCVRRQQRRCQPLQLKKADKAARREPFDGSINSWDNAFYQTRLEEQKYSVDQEVLREYFPMEVSLGLPVQVKSNGHTSLRPECWRHGFQQVLISCAMIAAHQAPCRLFLCLQTVTQGMFDIYQDMLGLNFTKNALLSKEAWAPDVTAYTVGVPCAITAGLWSSRSRATQQHADCRACLFAGRCLTRRAARCWVCSTCEYSEPACMLGHQLGLAEDPAAIQQPCLL